jgi:C4-dicarboxylate-specific signal transduction histidine kinase
VAHEVNNPLSYVKSNVTWARQELARAGDQALELVQALAESETGLARIQSIVADLRAFAREDDAPATCDAVQAAREALRLAAIRLARAAAMTPDLPDGSRWVCMSRTRLVQALVNLLVNAADALEGTGRRNGHIVVRLEDAPDHVVLSVADDGPGLSPEAAEHLFEPFFTTKGALGTGLGLALTREYVEHYGGSVEAGAAPGGGALFTLRLRRPSPDEEPSLTPAPVSRTGTP